MDVQESLAQIDHIMTEVDLELYQWQTDLDMMSFIGVNATFAMWTNEVPPRVVTARNISLLPLQGIHDVRVMHFTEDGWTKVGTAKINEDGNFVAQIDHDIPGLTDTNLNFSIDEIGNLKPRPWAKRVTFHPPFEGNNKPVSPITSLDEIIRKAERDLETHPFFISDKKEN